MRILISALLLASAAAIPAYAQDHPHGDGHKGEGGGPGGQGGDQHPAPGGGPGHEGGQPSGPHLPGGQGGYRPQPQPPQFPGGQGGYRPQPQPPQFPSGQGGYRGDPGGHDRRPGDPGHVGGRPDGGVNVWRHDRGDHGGGGHGGWDHDRGPGNGDWHGDRRGGWNQGWRDDRRYDWHGWRDSHRNYYHVSPYRAPYGYGYGYRRWGIGVRIDPVFFAQDYWISDPGYYRLPPAYDEYRWVRYYNDALLIDIGSGTVVDEIPDFFW